MYLCLFSGLWSSFYTYILTLLSLVMWIDRLIIDREKSLLQTGALFEIWVATLKISPLKTQKSSSKSLFHIDNVPKKVSCQQHNIQKQGHRDRWGHDPTTNQRSSAYYWEHRLLHTLRQPPMSNHRNGMKVSSFRCLLTWKSKWRNNKPN